MKRPLHLRERHARGTKFRKMREWLVDGRERMRPVVEPLKEAMVEAVFTRDITATNMRAMQGEIINPLWKQYNAQCKGITKLEMWQRVGQLIALRSVIEAQSIDGEHDRLEVEFKEYVVSIERWLLRYNDGTHVW